MELTPFAREYLLLGLRMGKIIEKYVDAYYGPQELEHLVKAEHSPSVDSLLLKCSQLQSHVKEQGFTQKRETYLNKNLIAMETSLRIKKGEHIPYNEKVKNLYDIKPIYMTDEQLSRAVSNLDSVYEGSGSLSERITPVYRRRTLPKKRAYTLFKKGIEIVRERTYVLFPHLLPISESVKIKEVESENWMFYNWYLGGYQSRIEIDITKRISWNSILRNAAHEGYPGHHTECSVKDKLLYQDQGRFEHCILLIHSPPMVMYEGVSVSAIDVLFSKETQSRLSLNYFCPNPAEESLEKLIEENIAWQGMKAYETNIAMHIYEDHWTDEEVIDYIMELGYTTEEIIRNTINFIRDPVWSHYIFNYFIGESLIKRKYGEHPTVKDFAYLLKNPVLPSDLG